MKHCVYLFSEGRVDFFVVLVALVLIFKDKIMEIINNAFDSISTGAEKI